MSYQHELIVEIGPVEEWQKKNDSNTGLRLVSNGDIDSMKIRANIEKTIVGVPNHARISIWNLSRKTRDAIKKPGLSVVVWAGNQGDKKEKLYTGSLLTAPTQRSGADWITTLICRTAYSNLVQNIISKSWNRDVTLDSVLREIVAQIPNVIYDPENKDITGKIGFNGFSYIGTPYGALNKLGDQFGFSWNIDNDVFHAIMDTKTTRTGIDLNSMSGLRKVSPRLSGIMQMQVGLDVLAIYRSGVQTGQLFRVEPTTDTSLTGNYKVHTIEYDLCPKDNTWDMSITTFILLGMDQ